MPGGGVLFPNCGRSGIRAHIYANRKSGSPLGLMTWRITATYAEGIADGSLLHMALLCFSRAVVVPRRADPKYHFRIITAVVDAWWFDSPFPGSPVGAEDRKSTRLNSSHSQI